MKVIWNFTCPSCGSKKLECCMDGSHTCVVTRIDEEGDFEYGPYESTADVDRWQCSHCGYVLKNKYGVIINNEDVVEWCKSNCLQE